MSEIAYGAYALRLVSNAYIICIKVPSPLYRINNQHDFMGWGENQRIMLHDKTWFLTLTPVENGSRVPGKQIGGGLSSANNALLLENISHPLHLVERG